MTSLGDLRARQHCTACADQQALLGGFQQRSNDVKGKPLKDSRSCISKYFCQMVLLTALLTAQGGTSCSEIGGINCKDPDEVFVKGKCGYQKASGSAAAQGVKPLHSHWSYATVNPAPGPLAHLQGPVCLGTSTESQIPFPLITRTSSVRISQIVFRINVSLVRSCGRN